MNNFQQSLDRYLTSEPEDDYTPYVEAVIDAYSEEFYQKIDGTKFEDSDIENKWLEKLNRKLKYEDFDVDKEGNVIPCTSGYLEITDIAKIIERAYKIYKLCA